MRVRFETSDGQADRLALRLMSLGFGIGSSLFALGTVLAVTGVSWANPAFATGAVCFTSAAFVQWRTAVHHSVHGVRRRAEFDLANPDWTSAVTQLVGTLYFNVMTIHALSITLTDPTTYNQHVWKPDVFGSALFLISSTIALLPAVRARRHRLLINERSLVIAWSNMFGSVLFGISALGAYAVAPDYVRSNPLNNVGTFLGAMGFLLASVLLWPAHDATPAATGPTSTATGPTSTATSASNARPSPARDLASSQDAPDS